MACKRCLATSAGGLDLTTIPSEEAQLAPVAATIYVQSLHQQKHGMPYLS